MNLVFRSWCYRFLLAGCGPVALCGMATADDDTPSDVKPAAAATAEDGGESANPAGPAKGRFREAMQERMQEFQRGEGGMRPDPDRIVAMLIDRFDEDKDQKLNAEELKKALGALRNMGGMGPGGPGSSGPGSGGPGSGGMGPEFITRLFEMNDKDGDGKLTGDEMPERMRQALDRVDRNGDGSVDKAEAEEMAARMNGGQRPGGGREGNTPSETRVPRRPPSE